MQLRCVRPLPLLLLIGLAAIVVACDSRPAPAPTPTANIPTVAPSATPTAEIPTLTPTATSEPPQPAVATAAATATPTPTTTPTPAGGGATGGATSTPVASRCEGLAGELEVQVLVGPSEAVGLEPFAVGRVPFAAATEPPYTLQGQSPVSYAETLPLQEGSYSVTMEMDLRVTGECAGPEGSEQLNMTLEMTGEQLVVVDAEGFHGEYPWAGTHTLDLTLPLEEGATAQGEGWIVVLHLGG